MSGTDQVWLAPAQRWTTRAGFGCSGLMGALSRRESLSLLAAAWDAGVRHFDVAPLYGHGEAERVLGAFLRGRRDQVTLVTKFGLEPTGHSALWEVARAIARPVARRVPALHRWGKATSRPSSPPVSLKPERARRSLERSLRALQTECVDVLLLHEATVELLTDDGLLAFLEGAVQKGLIRTFGVGGDYHHAAAVLQSRPCYCPVLQCDWSVLDERPPAFPGSQMIVFGVISQLRGGPIAAHTALPANADLARVALRAAAISLPESVILFSSRSPAHVAASAKAVSDTTLDSAAVQLRKKLGERRRYQ